jgi:hypothetical protein
MKKAKLAALFAASVLLTSLAPATSARVSPFQDGEKIRAAPQSNGAPEIHPGLLTGGLILLIGGTLVLVGRRARGAEGHG